MKFSGALRQHYIIQVNRLGRVYLTGKSWGPEERPIDAGRNELPTGGWKKAGRKQYKKSRQHNADLDE